MRFPRKEDCDGSSPSIGPKLLPLEFDWMNACLVCRKQRVRLPSVAPDCQWRPTWTGTAFVARREQVQVLSLAPTMVCEPKR